MLAQTAADKLLLLGWRGKGVEVDSGQLSTEALTALLSWLLRRVSGTGGQAAERKGEDGDPGSQLPRLLAAVARLGIIELDEAAVRGPALYQALDALCDLALAKQGMAWERPRYEDARWVPAASRQAQQQEQEEQRGQPPSVAEAKAADPQAGTTMKAKRELAALCSSKRARVDELRRELSTLTHRLQETRQKASALEPLLSQPLAARVVSTTDTAARVAKLKTALQVLEEESRRLDVRIGVAHHLLLFSWQQGARDQAAEEGESLLLQAANGPEGGADDEDENEDEPEE